MRTRTVIATIGELARKPLLLAALGVSLLGCAAQPPSAGGKLPQQLGNAEAICGNIIRLQKNRAEYQACVDSLMESGGARRKATDGQLAALLSPAPADSGPDGYFAAPDVLRRAREERACALLGLGDDVEAFVRCVVTLDMNLFIATHAGV